MDGSRLNAPAIAAPSHTLPASAAAGAPAREWLRTALDLAGVALIALYLAVFVTRNVSIQGDLRTYLMAARAALAGLDPYRPGALEALAARTVEPFVYPPVALLPFLPLADLPRATSAAIWMDLKLVLLPLLVLTWRRWFTPGVGLLPLTLVAVFGWNAAALWDLRAGNVALIECALLWSAFACFVSGRRAAFAALVVAAACFKIVPAAFLLLLLAPAGAERPSPSRLFAALATFAVLVFAPLAIGPAARWQGFLGQVPPANALGDANPCALALINDLARRAGLAEPLASRVGALAWLGYVAALIALSLPFLRRACRERDAARWVMGAVFLYVLIEPRPMAYGYALLAPAPLFFAPPPFHTPGGRLLLGLALAAQGLTRAANHQTGSLVFTHAPFLLTLCLWALVASGDRAEAKAAR